MMANDHHAIQALLKTRTCLGFAMQFLCHQLSVPPLLYADEQLAGVLFQTSKYYQNAEETVLGQITQPAAFALLIFKK